MPGHSHSTFRPSSIPSTIPSTGAKCPAHTTCPHLWVFTAHLIMERTGPVALWPRLHNTTNSGGQERGHLAHHQSPSSENSQTQGRVLFVELLSSNVLVFAWCCARPGGHCDLTMLCLKLRLQCSCHPGAAGRWGFQEGIMPLREIMQFSWDWISYRESMLLDIKSTLVLSPPHTPSRSFVFHPHAIQAEDFARSDHPAVAYRAMT